MWVKKAQGGSGVGPYEWPEDGSVCEVPDPLGTALIAITGGGYTQVDGPPAETAPATGQQDQKPAGGDDPAGQQPAAPAGGSSDGDSSKPAAAADTEGTPPQAPAKGRRGRQVAE